MEMIKEKIEQGYEIPVLDKGFVRYIDHMGSDERIVEAARISYKSPSKGPEQDEKLLRYLYQNKHTSPFEMCKITLNIKMPIFVMRQYVRHRMQNLNEVSARYTKLEDDFYIPDKWRAQDLKNKQGSIILDDWFPKITVGSETVEGHDEVSRLFEFQCKEIYKIYESMLDSGVSREMARMILPVNIYTEIYTCWDVKNLLHFIRLRDDTHAQFEIQEYGKAIKDICTKLFPVTMAVYEEFG